MITFLKILEIRKLTPAKISRTIKKILMILSNPKVKETSIIISKTMMSIMKMVSENLNKILTIFVEDSKWNFTWIGRFLF